MGSEVLTLCLAIRVVAERVAALLAQQNCCGSIAACNVTRRACTWRPTPTIFNYYMFTGQAAEPGGMWRADRSGQPARAGEPARAVSQRPHAHSAGSNSLCLVVCSQYLDLFCSVPGEERRRRGQLVGAVCTLSVDSLSVSHRPPMPAKHMDLGCDLSRLDMCAQTVQRPSVESNVIVSGSPLILLR